MERERDESLDAAHLELFDRRAPGELSERARERNRESQRGERETERERGSTSSPMRGERQPLPRPSPAGTRASGSLCFNPRPSDPKTLPAISSFNAYRALSEPIKFTVRRHTFNEDSFSCLDIRPA